MTERRDLIEQHPDIMLGKPVFAGTRLTVEHILRELRTGASDREILEAYPNLRPEYLDAARRWSNDAQA